MLYFNDLYLLLPDFFFIFFFVSFLIFGLLYGTLRQRELVFFGFWVFFLFSFFYLLLLSEQIQNISRVFFFFDIFELSRWCLVIKAIVILFFFFYVIFFFGNLKVEGLLFNEVIFFMFVSLFGFFCILKVRDLFSFYIFLELNSLALYLLVASKKNSRISVEAGIKYFVLSSLSSLMLLLGISQIYVNIGSVSLEDIKIFLYFFGITSNDLCCVQNIEDILNFSIFFIEVDYFFFESVDNNYFNLDFWEKFENFEELFERFYFKFFSMNLLDRTYFFEADGTFDFSNISYLEWVKGIVLERQEDSVEKSLLDFFFFQGWGFLFLGFCFVLIGVLFKVGLFPFHFWLPDVYEGAPAVSMGFLTIFSKVPFLFFFLKFFYIVFFFETIYDIVLFFSFLSVIIGTLGALRQMKVKRFLAFGSISHFGFMVFSFFIGSANGLEAGFFYLFVYMFLSLNFFGFFLNFRKVLGFNLKEVEFVSFLDFSMLFKTHRYVGLALVFNFFALAGIPPLMGFFSKFFLFWGLLEMQFFGFFVFFLIYSFISVFYYIRIIRFMVFDVKEKWEEFYKVEGGFFSLFLFFFLFFFNILFLIYFSFFYLWSSLFFYFFWF